MSSTSPARGDVDIDLPRLAVALWEKRVALAAATLLVGLAVFFMMSSVAPLYRAESRILIEARNRIAGPEDQAPRSTEGVLDAQAIASQVEVIRSADIIASVIEDLELAGNPEFDPAASPSVLRDFMVLFGLADDPLEEPSSDRILATFREKLQVYQVQNSRVIAIEFSSENSELAAQIANALADAYLAVQSGAKLATTTGAAAWLEPEIAALRERVREAEARVAAYRAETGLFMVGENNTLSQRQLSDISAELSRVRAERADAEARARNVQTALDAGRSTDAIGSVLDSTLIQRLREREIGIQSEIADLSTTLLDNHPRIRALRSQLADLDQQIRGEIRKAVDSLESDAAIAGLREEELVGRMNALKANSAEAGAEEVELRALEREAAAERQLLESYLGSYRQAASLSTAAALPADARIIARAIAPSEPYYPKPLVIAVVAMVATAMIFAIGVLLAELMSGRALRPVAAAPVPVAVPPARIEATSGSFTVAPGPAPGPQDYRVVQQKERAAPQVEAAIDAEIAAELERTAQAIEARAAVADAAPVRKTGHEGMRPDNAPAVPAEAVALLPAAAVQEDADDVSLAAVAEALTGRRVSVVACLSPEGDRASLGAVQLARFLADCGARPLLIDLTASAAPSAAMTDGAALLGATDLLTGAANIADAIHADLHSAADIVPLGLSSAQEAMRAASRLPMIVEALANAYDMVLVECGAVEPSGLKRLTGNLDIAVVLSIVEPDEAVVTPSLTALLAAGYDDALVLMVEDDLPPDARSASAA